MSYLCFFLDLFPAAVVMKSNMSGTFNVLGRKYKFMWLPLLGILVMAYAEKFSNFLTYKCTNSVGASYYVGWILFHIILCRHSLDALIVISFFFDGVKLK